MSATARPPEGGAPVSFPIPLKKGISREALGRRRVMVVGDVMLDRYWFGEVDRISPEAPVPVVRISREEERLGGAANVAYNVQMLGVPTTLLTVVGADDAAQRLQRLLDERQVAHVLGQDASLQTIVKLRVIGRSQQLLRIDFENQPSHEVLAQLLADLLSRSSLISLMYQSSHSAEHSRDEHVAIVDALERGDARAAVRLTEAHLSNVERNLRLHPRTSDLQAALRPHAAPAHP